MYYRQWYVCNHQAELQFENVINKALCFHNRTWAKNLWWKHMCLYSCWISGQWLLWRMIPCFQSITHKPQFTFSLPWTITKRRQTSLLFPLKTRIRVDCVCVCVCVCVWSKGQTMATKSNRFFCWELCEDLQLWREENC